MAIAIESPVKRPRAPSNAELLARLKHATYGSKRLLRAVEIACDRIASGKLDAGLVDAICAARRRAWVLARDEEHARLMTLPELPWWQLPKLKLPKRKRRR